MMDQEQKPKRKRKTKAAQPEVEFSVGETFEPSKEADFDLNLKEMQYTARSGQAGTRCKATGFDGQGASDPRADGSH